MLGGIVDLLGKDEHQGFACMFVFFDIWSIGLT